MSMCRLLNSTGGSVFFFVYRFLSLEHEDCWYKLLIRCFLVLVLWKYVHDFRPKPRLLKREDLGSRMPSLNQRKNVTVSVCTPSVCPSECLFPLNICFWHWQGADRDETGHRLIGRLWQAGCGLVYTVLVHMFVIPNLAGNFHVQNEFIELVYHRDDICTFCQARLIDWRRPLTSRKYNAILKLFAFNVNQLKCLHHLGCPMPPDTKLPHVASSQYDLH